jgi:phosphoserine phosphatase RsbU/P
MDEQLNHAPCGYLTMSEQGNILSINQTLLKALDHNVDQLIGQNFNLILSVPARIFYQLYFFPLMNAKGLVEEMYITLEAKNGEEIPFLINAVKTSRNNRTLFECALIPIPQRSEYENELLMAKKDAESALLAMNKVNEELEIALKRLKMKRDILLQLNQQNQKYKMETENELELARKIQETLLSDPISNEHLEIEAYYKACKNLSGDIYGFYQIDQHQYGIILLDVMGHGLSSALITMSLHSLFHRLISRGVRANIVMKELDNHLHTLFLQNEEAHHYCTAIYLLVNTQKHEIEYINAGHPPALWQDCNGKQMELFATAPPLGTFEGIQYQTNTFTYSKGGRLLLYTDGVADPLGSNHLYSLLAENPSADLSNIKERIIESLLHEENIYHKNDDQCFILVNLK